MSSITSTDTDRELKAKHRTMWASGDYAAVAREVIPDLGRVLVTACGVGPGTRVLDVAAGSGNAAIPAALTGASVVASDLTPALLEAGGVEAARAGAILSWEEGDAEALSYADASFDVVMSCVGVMFAPHHQEAADEMARVCRPAGTIGLASWTPGGFVGQLLAAMKPYAPAPPPGSSPAPLWGQEDYVCELFGDRVSSVRAERRTVFVDRFRTGAQFRDYVKTKYGPVVAVYHSLSADPARTEALDRDLADLATRHQAEDGSMRWEYLLVTATRV